MKKLILIITVLLIVGAFMLLPNYLSESKNILPVEVTIKKGTSLSNVGKELQEEGIIISSLWFRYKGRNVAINIKPGNYIIEPNSDVEEILQIFQKGIQEEQIVVTFPEGYTLYQIGEELEKAGLVSIDEFIKETENYFIEQKYDFDTSELYYSMEGYLFPDTYFFTKQQSVQDIVKTLAKTMDLVLTEDYKNKAKELGYSIHQILTIASIIERESFNNEERAVIAGVIENRLEAGMPLQIDATVIYGIGKGKEHMTRVLNVDLKKENPYNTYINTGLPPGPIASPGKKSIEAALYPEDNDYFYYVMGENGHVFSKTYEEFLVNKSRYLKMVNSK